MVEQTASNAGLGRHRFAHKTARLVPGLIAVLLQACVVAPPPPVVVRRPAPPPVVVEVPVPVPAEPAPPPYYPPPPHWPPPQPQPAPRPVPAPPAEPYRLIQGVHIPAGSCIKYPIGAANRDPAVFENPDEFDYNRPPEASRNLTFGLGTHACAGQLLARAETSVILGLVAERYSSVELAGDPLEVRTDRLVAFDKLPVRLY